MVFDRTQRAVDMAIDILSANGHFLLPAKQYLLDLNVSGYSYLNPLNLNSDKTVFTNRSIVQIHQFC